MQTFSIGQATHGDSFKFYIVMPHRYYVCDGKYFSLTPAINKLLFETDMIAKCPVQYLKLPYRNVFVDCGIERDIPLKIHNTISGAHVFEGAYVTEIFHPEKDRKAFTNNCNTSWKQHGYQSKLIHRSLEFLLCGSPVGKKDILDDAYFSFSLHITDENEPIDSVVNKGIELYKKQAGYQKSSEVEDHLNAILHIIKTIILINTKNCNLIEKNHKDELLNQIRREPLKYKKTKLMKQRKYAHNMIYIDLHEKDKQSYSGGLFGQSKCKTHWRRGHFRMLKANPPNRPHPKPTWVKPCIVNASDDNNHEAANKSYSII